MMCGSGSAAIERKTICQILLEPRHVDRLQAAAYVNLVKAAHQHRGHRHPAADAHGAKIDDGKRHLERGLGVDVAGLRRRIARALPPAPAEMPDERAALVCGGLRYHLARDEGGAIMIVTVTSAQRDAISNRARRMRCRLASLSARRRCGR